MQNSHQEMSHGRNQSHVQSMELKIETSQYRVGSQNLRFSIKLSGKHLSPEDLEISHEMPLHVLIFNSNLEDLYHVHCRYLGSEWEAPINFQEGGSYHVWVQGRLAHTGQDFSVHSVVEVQGQLNVSSSHLSLPEDSVLRSEIQDSIVRISADRFKSKVPFVFDILISRIDKSEVKVSPYLGALAHLIAIDADTGQLVHLHPMESESKTQLSVHAEFPHPGFYRLWVEFIDQKVLKVGKFWLKVT